MRSLWKGCAINGYFVRYDYCRPTFDKLECYFHLYDAISEDLTC